RHIHSNYHMDGNTKRIESLTQSQGFKAAEAHLKEVELVNRSFLRIYADLRAVRELQGPDADHPEQRAAIDQLFDISPGMVRLSPEILPSVRKLIGRAVDTRAFDMAAWSVTLTHGDRLQIDQFLVANEEKVKREYSHVVASWSTPAAPMDFMSFLPADTWFVG